MAASSTTVKEACKAQEDYQVITASILKLASDLEPHVQFTAENIPTGHPLPLSQQSLDAELKRAQELAHDLPVRGGACRNIPSGSQSAMSDECGEETWDYDQRLAWKISRWKYLEALYLLAFVSRCQTIDGSQPIALFEQIGPLSIRWQGKHCYVWTRPEIAAMGNRMTAVPSLVVTTSPRPVSPFNILFLQKFRCMAEDRLRTEDLYEECVRALTLCSPCYSIACYHRFREGLKESAHALGMELDLFPLSSDERDFYISGKKDLCDAVADSIEQNWENQRFLSLLQKRQVHIKKKLLRP